LVPNAPAVPEPSITVPVLTAALGIALFRKRLGCGSK
jgi:hypothetical protein